MSVGQEQARLLVAMGLEPMCLREAGDALRRQLPEVVVRAPPDGDRARPGPPVPVRAPAAPARPGLLLEALRRAAGGRDIGELAADIEGLRREPALKRALWPRLRALRRH